MNFFGKHKSLKADEEGDVRGGRVFRTLKLGAVVCLILIVFSYVGIYVLYSLFDFTSSNAVVYFVKGSDGRIEATRDLDFDSSDKMIFMLDLTSVVSMFMGLTANAVGEPMLDVTWDENIGKGEIKDFRPDGSIFSVTFSRFKEKDGRSYGLFIGGDLPYGDFDRDKERRNSGMGYYKDKNWYHVWCAANEGFVLKPEEDIFLSKDWIYLGSRVIKRTRSEVLIESRHRLPIRDRNLYMKRKLQMRSGWDYVVLSVTFANKGDSPIKYTYGYGDEPWVGLFFDSRGDVGWSEGMVLQNEGYITPWPKGYAGYWDHGNDAINEGRGFSDVANFIQWLSVSPSDVYFSNDLRKVDEKRPLDSFDNRSINLVWNDQILQPGETKTYTLAIGMAKSGNNGFPVKPKVEYYE